MPFVSVIPLVRLAYGAIMELSARAAAIEHDERPAAAQPRSPAGIPARLHLRHLLIGALLQVAHRLSSSAPRGHRAGPPGALVRSSRRSIRILAADWSAAGDAEEARCRQLARKFAARTIDDVASSLVEHDALEPLVDDVVSYLLRSRELPLLVDEIVRYLTTQPEMLVLIHEQSAQVTTRFLERARARAVAADDAVDRAARAVFRRRRRRR